MPIVNALTCPNCGGAVEVGNAQQGIVKCTYCGTTLQIPELEHPPEPPTGPAESSQTTYQPPRIEIDLSSISVAKPARSGIKALVLTLIALVAIGGLTLVVITLIPQATTLNLRLWNEVVPIGSGEMGPPDLIARVEVGDDEQHRLALLDGQTRRVRWQSGQVLSDETRNHLPLPAGDLIYFPDRSSLFAFKASDGTLAWQQPMANAIDTSCRECLRLIEGQVVALSKDGTLQAFNALSGTPAWKVSLNTSPRELLLAAGRPAVVDQDSEKHNGLFIFDPRSGQMVDRVGSNCTVGQTIDQLSPGRVSDVYLSPNGLLAYIMYYDYGFGQPPCVQQVDLSTGRIVWEISPQEGQVWPNAWFAADVLVSEEGIFFYEDNVLSLINAKTGELRALYQASRYRDVTPLVSLPGRVVVMAIPDYDSETKELWGIDTTSGQRVWNYKVQARSIIDPWRVRLTTAGLVVVQGLRDRKASTWEVLDPLTGASQGEKTISTSHYDFLDDSWTATTAYLTFDATLYAVDITTSKILYTWH